MPIGRYYPNPLLIPILFILIDRDRERDRETERQREREKEKDRQRQTDRELAHSCYSELARGLSISCQVGRINLRLTEGYNGLYKINNKTTWLMAKPTLRTKALYSGLVTTKYSFSEAALHKEPLKFTSVVLHLKEIESSSFCNFNRVITDATGTRVDLWLP